MNNRPAKPAGMSWLIPYLMVQDAGKAAQFYRDVFGFEALGEAKDEHGNVMHAEMRYKDIVIMCGTNPNHSTKTKAPAHAFSTPITLYLYCEDVDAKYAHIKQAKAHIITELEDSFWGDRNFTVADLDGNAWCFATNIATH